MNGNDILNYWQSLRLRLQRTQNTFQGQITEIDFVPQLDRRQPPLLFPALPARIVVQSLKETTDKPDEKMPDDGEGDLRASQFEDHDMDQLLALHHATLCIRSDF